MPQVTIYINDELDKRIKATASTLDISLSKLISGILEQKLNNQWNPLVRQLAGSWDTFPDLEEIRESTGKDVERESF